MKTKNVTIRVIITLIYVQQLPKSTIKGTICPFAKVCQKKLLQNTVHIHNKWVGTNLSIGGSPIGHNPMVSSISSSFILQVLQDRLMLRIRQVTQLTILASSTLIHLVLMQVLAIINCIWELKLSLHQNHIQEQGVTLI